MTGGRPTPLPAARIGVKRAFRGVPSRGTFAYKARLA